MALTDVLSHWRTDPSVGPNIAAWQTIPAHPPLFSAFPPDLAPQLQTDLTHKGIHSLYQHQAEAWEALRSNKNILLATGTASGKSLAYQLPILNDLYRGLDSSALLLFPTKALARDQLKWLNSFPDIKVFPYDGDTPANQRKSIRENASVVITNPDMLHIGILPYHTSWVDFFSRLRYIVLDEIHIYRGVFGSHVANVIRRLKRLASHYGVHPQFILTSATIGNPRQLAQSLINEDIELIQHDSSGGGEKHFLIYNPPILDRKLGTRASMQDESVRLASDLISAGLQTIIFGRSRRSVEFTLTKLQQRASLPAAALQSYRSGYLPEQRRKIEADLRAGRIRGIAATTALELGIDIGGLDGAILAGYPGSIAASWQQAGRAGRTEKSSLAVLVASSSPLDQYLCLHPEFILKGNPENALIAPDNLLIALAHLGCAAYELPFPEGSSYGSFTALETQELLDALQSLGKLHHSTEQYFWISTAYPAADISLRSTSLDQIALRLTAPDGTKSLLGTIDYESALWMVHPGAVYLHAGDPYQVKNLDLEENQADLVPFERSYYTEAVKQTQFDLIDKHDQAAIPGGVTGYGDIEVTAQVTGYKKINWSYYELLGIEPLDLPATRLSTVGAWLQIEEQTESVLREHGLWTSSPNQYGPDWESIRTAILSRDHYACANCGQSGSAASLHVHHKIPLRSFPSYQQANQPQNLITLCPRCHRRAEAIVRVNSGVHGLGYLLHSLAPLLLMCDPGDLGVYSDLKSPFGNQRPTVMLYENTPAGIGFGKFLFNHFPDLLRMAYQAVSDCPCLDGCPSCVGPGGENGSGGKEETKAILEILVHGFGSPQAE